MVKVTLNGTTIADSNDTIVVEGNQYFPPASLVDKDSIFTPSETTSVCPWKGVAAYYNAKLPDGTVVKDVAWYYPKAKDDRAKNIEGYVAFYKNKVTIN